MKNPDIRLFIATGCPHCAQVLQTLSELLKAGEIVHLRISNISKDIALAEKYQVRSVPWLAIGPFELTGDISKQEIRQWLGRVHSDKGMQAYLLQLFAEGELDKVIALVNKAPDILQDFTRLLADPDTPIIARIGISAVLEELQGNPELKLMIPHLIPLTESDNPTLRNDASYFLGLTHHPEALPTLEKLRNEANKDIRETVLEAIEMIQNATKSGS